MKNHDVTHNAEGLYSERPESISTWYGRIDPLRPDPSEIDIRDISHALARLCRYNGHVGGFLSVARHSLWVSEHLEVEGAPVEIQLQGLLHDGAEAYLSDIPRPVKLAPEMDVFRMFDQRMDQAVADAFGLPFPLHESVKAADRHVLMEIEMKYPGGARFTWNSTPEDDEEEFLLRYEALTGGTVPRAVKPRTRTLIGLSGYARAGKDTAARVLTEYFGFTRVSFADKLKAVISDLDPVLFVDQDAPPLTDRWGHVMNFKSAALSTFLAWGATEEWLKEHTTYRRVAQRMGQSVRERLGEDTWVDAALAGVEYSDRIVITDVRYPNEADAIVAAGGEIWRIERGAPANAHISETALDGYRFDRVINNHGSVLEFDRKIHACTANYFAGRRR